MRQMIYENYFGYKVNLTLACVIIGVIRFISDFSEVFVEAEVVDGEMQYF